MKRNIALMILFCVIVAAGLFCLLARSFCRIRKERDMNTSQTTEYETSVSFKQKTEDYPLKTVPGTSTDMLCADYWIEKRDNRVLFSKEEISAFGQNNTSYVLYYSVKENRDIKLFQYDLPDCLGKAIIEALMDLPSIDNLQSDLRAQYVNGETKTDEYWEQIIKNCGFDSIPETVIPCYAVCIQRTMAKQVPTDDFAASNPDEHFIDSLVSAEVMPYSGAVILHESVDGEWCFILNGSFCGWVRKTTLTVCSGKDQWLMTVCPDRFLVVTGSEIVMDETAVQTASSGMILPMGTKLKLADDPLEIINGRSTLGCFVVELPCRNKDGTIGWEMSLIPVSKDVHVGYMAMTSSSVVTQAFKFLGRVYGWGGTLSSNDCSGMIRQIYSCYGFDLPRNALTIAKLADLGSSECLKMTHSRKLHILQQMAPGQLLYMNGHLMMYLGMENGIPYVISSCGSYIEPEDDALHIHEAYCVFVSNMELLRANGKTWLDDISYFLWKDY